ncbi:hypothetical protein CYMTET_13285 [Cymbomonas tetramitiformis]|uniref:Tetratricopeptide repeat protein n=1 Tax=Cymbomonas tetramitiformis TaxID=36881 RepID=A0AAE0GIN8_9CHLO|nr:hypothetical protein CYMTET_13285 [Cymbomonas tetramitiformis]
MRVGRRSALFLANTFIVGGSDTLPEALAATYAPTEEEGVGTVPPLGITLESTAELQAKALLAFEKRDFKEATRVLSELVAREPKNEKWLEGRAQALLDGKAFTMALRDYDSALEIVRKRNDLNTQAEARLVAGRGLVHEGLYDWRNALTDYDTALRLTKEAGFVEDPYTLNSRGNVYSSLGMYEEARRDFLQSSEYFQTAKGFKTNKKLDGSIYASSNAALMLAQLGDIPGAIKEVERVRRRAPNSADMRAALAAMYWSQGRGADAEDIWEYACNNVLEGCANYRNSDWLSRIRRWPPVMVNLMDKFLRAELLQSTSYALLESDIYF